MSDVQEIAPHLDGDDVGNRRILRDLLWRKAIAEARGNFYAYVKLMADHPSVVPEGFTDGAHIRFVCDKLQKVEEGVIRNLILTLPPGGMKTLLCLLFETWCIGRRPTNKVIAVGHSASFAARRFGGPSLEIVSSPLFQEIFPEVQLKKDAQTGSYWETTVGGRYLAAGAGSSIAGQRANLAVVDDVLSEQTAYSKIERDRINEWWIPGLNSRILPGGRRILILTRWHLEDLAGYVLALDQKSSRPMRWEVIQIPAILDKKSAKLIGGKEGESYWPEMWPTEGFLEIKEAATPHVWNALYMQNPIADDGNLFPMDKVQIWEKDDPPKLTELVMVMDTAYSEKETADYSVIGTFGIFETLDKKGKRVSNCILLGLERGRWAFPDLRDITHELYKEWKPDWVIVEKKASGQSLLQELRESNIPVMEFTPVRDKISRAHSVTPFIQSGRLWIPALEWALPLTEEMQSFPNGKHDDCVDVVVMVLRYLRDTYKVRMESDWDWDEEPKPVKKHKTYWQLAR